MKFKQRRQGKQKIQKFGVDKKQKTGHKAGKGLNHSIGKKVSRKGVMDSNQDTPLRPAGNAPAANRADQELKRLIGS